MLTIKQFHADEIALEQLVIYKRKENKQLEHQVIMNRQKKQHKIKTKYVDLLEGP